MESEAPQTEEYAVPAKNISNPPGSSPNVVSGGPAFGQQFGKLNIDNENLDTEARVAADGRVDIEFTEKRSRRLSTLTQVLSTTDLQLPIEFLAKLDRDHYDEPPSLRIVIQIIGSRGDIQPFIALGKELKTYGHRVRVATHPTFKDFVEENGLEFFSVGGDPAELMSYMVRNPGLIPGIDSIRAGDISARRKNMYEMMVQFWFSCINPNTDTDEPFVADAIIANPPSYAHIHCAQKLGVPLHMMFTMPWSATHEFPHPLANVNSTNLEPSTTNFMTYPMVDLLTWQGLGDLVNKFRTEVLRIDELDAVWAPSLIQRAKIPFTYCWSPALIPKPKDWGENIDISGFFFLDLASNYSPPDALAAFLAAGPPPVYIGFGSIVVKDPAALTKLIFDAVKILGIRALVSKGWGGLGGEEVPPNIFMLGNCPHDWLFKQVSAVVHHGGAGTTAIGLRLGRPTVIVPFFGDQAFWARMVFAAGAGPEPVPFKGLTAGKLAKAIKVALSAEATTAAANIAKKMADENGATTAAKSFHKMLPLKDMRCSILPKKLAVWQVKKTNILLSSYASIVLVENKLLKSKDLTPCTYWSLDVNPGPYEPFLGSAGNIISASYSVALGFGYILAAPGRAAYMAAKNRKMRLMDSEISSIRSETQSISGTMTPPKRQGSTLSQSSLRSEPMQKSASDQPRVNPHLSTSETIDQALINDLGRKGFGRIAKTMIEAPIDLSMSMAQGWHNLPVLYGQKVRKVQRIEGFKTGVKEGGKQFGLGIYDGVAGFVMDPYEGAKKEGYLGFVKGFGMGTLDLFVKARLWALPAYTLKGAELSTKNFKYRHEFSEIFGKRFILGLEEFHASTKADRDEIVMMWKEKGFAAQLAKRGEVKDHEFKCPLEGCEVTKLHHHFEDEDELAEEDNLGVD